MFSRTATLPAVLATAALLTGCTDGGGAQAEAPVPADERSSGESGSQATVQDRDGPVLVEQTVVPDPNSPEDSATVGVQSLTVEGPTMVLRLVVTPDFASESDSQAIDLGEAVNVGVEFFGVQLRLLDRENLKEYSVIHDGPKWWASPGEVSSTNGQPMYAFAVFAAPEDDIQTVDVVVDPSWPQFIDVPITR